MGACREWPEGRVAGWRLGGGGCHGIGIHAFASARLMLIQLDEGFVSSSPFFTRTCSHAERRFHVLLSTLLQMVNSCPGSIAPICSTSERIKGRNGNGLGLSSCSIRGFSAVLFIPMHTDSVPAFPDSEGGGP